MRLLRRKLGMPAVQRYLNTGPATFIYGNKALLAVLALIHCPPMETSEPALVPGIIFCDYVIREQGSGKLTLVGCFQAFVFKEFPAKKNRFFVVVGVTNLRGQIKEINITARIEDSKSGHVLASASGKLEFTGEGEMPMIQPMNVIELPLPINEITFPAAGTYSAVVLVDNEEISRRNFPVLSVTSAST